ncbi:RagB/SusD family nutrient uptake outer membrane protein [Sphingobacterium tabacisoli]|uniref:RagB/SusD family nutrient uptake outer membrane protein n=1 Tax=Sphingobacterium tabacisoli TaxID=2044855 RepID=A0ABW5L3P1_9SPHI|nr:RagB/SusD family nutrient uptake outer membrane protein [Sphingobacterium tabacisoli]
MQKKKNIDFQLVLTIVLTMVLSGCESFLSEKSDKSLGTPSTIEDFEALLNDWGVLNSTFSSLGDASSDDLYLTTEDYNGLHYESDKRLYTWQPDYVSRSVASAGNEWAHCYNAIYVCNAVLDGLEKNGLKGYETDKLKGQALTFRAARYLDGVQIWSPVYRQETADVELGMVIRLDPDVNIISARATVGETYSQIIKDLEEALPLLPLTSVSPALPTKAAAHGLLARVYLVIGDYAESLRHAEESLKYNEELIDFNGLSVEASFPIPVVNQMSKEIIFFTRMYSSEIVNNLNIARVSSSLYELYKQGDLRRDIYFRKDNAGNFYFKGTHMGHRGLITGITTSELMLIIAECNVRLKKLSDGAFVLNKLLVKRWDNGHFVPYTFENTKDALTIVLEERRKELLFRGLRWGDLKRFNRDGAEITLTRIIGDTYTLQPNDKRYAIAIPEDIVDISRVKQNPR